MPKTPADEGPREIDAIRVRLDLMDSIADLLHVLNAEAEGVVDDQLNRSAWVFNELWNEIHVAVAAGQGHYIKEAIEPDEFARELIIVNKREFERRPEPS